MKFDFDNPEDATLSELLDELDVEPPSLESVTISTDEETVEEKEGDEFDPYQSNRPPRQEGWEEETEEIFDYLRERGDLRIGQYLINAVTCSDEWEMQQDMEDWSHKEIVENILWNIEASDLLQAIKDYEDRSEEGENQ